MHMQNTSLCMSTIYNLPSLSHMGGGKGIQASPVTLTKSSGEYIKATIFLASSGLTASSTLIQFNAIKAWLLKSLRAEPKSPLR